MASWRIVKLEVEDGNSWKNSQIREQRKCQLQHTLGSWESLPRHSVPYLSNLEKFLEIDPHIRE